MEFSVPWNYLSAIRFSLLFISASLIALCANSQKFPASTIPDSLKENANVVIRLYEESWEIKSPKEASVKRHCVYTILNEKGSEYATWESEYSKSTQLNSVNGYLYDAAGKEIRRFKKKDMDDFPYYDGSSFVNDDRVKKSSFSYSNYPYTVEFEEESDEFGFMSVGGWQPQMSLQDAVELSKFSIVVPEQYNFKYRMLNSKVEPLIEQKNNKQTYTWQIKGLTAYEEVPFAAEYAACTPYLLTALGDIDVEGFKGNMCSWNEFGKFYGSLQKGRDILPDETKRKVHEIISGLSDPYAKVAALYSFLQQNTHYVNVRLGIGGWQASEASYVAIKKYGDCKALSNFMVALLKEAGIKANPVVIRGGEETMEFVPDFTYDPFNHVICCVPLEKDTVWLECTDQFLPPGYLSEFTANRYGLMVTEQGGSLVHTPAYLLADNIRSRKINAIMDTDGNLKLDCNTSYRALCQDPIEGMIHHQSKEQILNELKSLFNLPTYNVISFHYDEDYSKRLPVMKESLQITVSNYAQVSGKRIFINPDILSRSNKKLTPDKHRKLDIKMDDEYRYMDSVQIFIPTGYEIESKREDLVLNSKYGSYKDKTIVMEDKIMYYRTMEQYSGRFPAKDYDAVVKFYNDIYDADHTSIVLVKKN